jgi:DNA replication protein DnaC
MLDHPTHDQLRSLKLDGMADAFAELQDRDDAADLNHAEWLGLLIDRETASRSTKKFQTRMRAAKLRHVGACIEDVDYRAPASSTGRCSGLSPQASGSRSAGTC